MKTVKIKYTFNLRTMALTVIFALCFAVACQEEENGLGETSKTYEELAAEVKSLATEIKSITDNYPDFRIDMRTIYPQKKNGVEVNTFEEVITGVDNSADKRKIATKHYQMHQLREQMYGLPDATGTYTAVEDQPSPENGIQEFYTYISKNLKYPKEARQKGIEGKVFLEFVVDADGSITEVKTLKGIGAGCDEEAERVLKNAAAWNPGRHNGEPVKVRMVLPVTYRL